METTPHGEQSPALFFRFSTFRTIVLIVLIFVIAWIGISASHYLQSKRQIRELFRRQAHEMASMLALSERSMTRALERIEDEQASRLTAIGYWLRDLDSRQTLSLSEIQRVADESSAFNIVLFKPTGERELGLRGGGPRYGAPPWAGRDRLGRGQNSQHEHSTTSFLESGEEAAVEGFHKAGRMGEFRFSVFVRRKNGGAVLINLDTAIQEQLRRDFGPEALLSQFTERPEILYLRRKQAGTIDIDLGHFDPTEIESNAEAVEVNIPDQDDSSLIVGFDNTAIRRTEYELLQRLLLSAGLAATLGALLIIWSRLTRRHGQLAKTLAQISSYHRTVLETMDDAVLAWNEHAGMTFWNPKAESLFP